MRSLFSKIFLSFLGTMAVMIISVVLVTFHFAVDRFEESEGVSPPTVFITAALVLENHGKEALAEWLKESDDLPPPFQLLAVGEDGKDLLGRPVPKRMMRHFEHRHRMEQEGRRRGPPGPGARVQAPDGEVFRLALHRLPLGPFGILGISYARWVVLATALAVAALASYLLARYLSSPVLRLQTATREIASGNLAARAGASVGKRRDEIGVLARDFDAMAARLEALLKSQQELLRSISHELRSPLARITVALGLARRKGDAASTELERIELEAERLDALIGDVLRLASLDQKRQPLANDVIALADLVDDVLQDANFEADGTGKTARRAGDDTVKCKGDGDLLRSAVENVVRNAMRYTPESTEVTVQLETDGNEVILRVRDHGPGVGEDELAAIFEPFYRVAEARDRDSGGTGLGLAIAAACIKRHGGQVSAHNAGGGGLEVVLRLPAAGPGAA
ncbi:MAG: ATP-binding protein [Pseudomonadota bacterium]